jgi:hypothetical protein
MKAKRNKVNNNEFMRTKINVMIASLAILMVISCSKKEPLEDPAINLADNDAVSEAVFDDIFNSVDDAEIKLEDYLKGTKSAEAETCPAVTFDRAPDSNWPKTVTIDYGTGCTGFYDITRSGKIIMTLTGPRLEEGSVRSVTLDNYYINGIRIEGTKQVTNLGINDKQQMEFSVTLTGGKITLENGQVIKRSFERTRVWTAGKETASIWDDEFRITGTATGVNRNGTGYTNTIITPVLLKRTCRFAVSGVIKIEIEGLPEPVELDYGDGECDATAVITIAGKSKEITLRYRFAL